MRGIVLADTAGTHTHRHITPVRPLASVLAHDVFPNIERDGELAQHQHALDSNDGLKSHMLGPQDVLDVGTLPKPNRVAQLALFGMGSVPSWLVTILTDPLCLSLGFAPRKQPGPQGLGHKAVGPRGKEERASDPKDAREAELKVKASVEADIASGVDAAMPDKMQARRSVSSWPGEIPQFPSIRVCFGYVAIHTSKHNEPYCLLSVPRQRLDSPPSMSWRCSECW